LSLARRPLIGVAQAAVEASRKEYKCDRPHQSLTMAFPAPKLIPASDEVVGLRGPRRAHRGHYRTSWPSSGIT
jgi:hypothetical protein